MVGMQGPVIEELMDLYKEPLHQKRGHLELGSWGLKTLTVHGRVVNNIPTRLA